MLALQASALMALFASVSGHIIMGTPAPFDFENPGSKQAPLELADFPCKQPAGSYKFSGKANTYKAGENMKVTLIGGATHSGGSCQVSITTDAKPNKDTQWKVLFSQIGGCPRSGDGNASGDANDTGNSPMNVPIPKDIPSGKYTVAWSWNNKTGNREFYMNCAPVEIQGEKGDAAKALSSLPDMFVINLPPTSCELASGQDALYPNPGKAVATGTGAKPGLKISGAGCGAMTKLGAGAGKMGSAGPATDKPAASKSTAKPAASSKPTGAVLAPSADAPSAAPAKSTEAAAAPSAPAAAPATGSSGTSCTTGAVVCISSTQFGICSNGVAVPQAVAVGTTCTNGKIARRSFFSSFWN
jgi:hypothetical protein